MIQAPVAVRVAVDARADRPERTFSYRLPDAVETPAPGSLLLVPYGRRLALGYLVGEDPSPAAPSELKEVEAVVSEPMLTPDLLRLAEEIADHYRAPIGSTLAAMLPPGLESRVERRWRIERPADLPAELQGAVSSDDGWITDAELLRHAPRHAPAAWIESLRRSGALRATWSLRGPQVSPRSVRVLRRAAPGEAPRRAPMQRAVLEALGEDERTLPDVAAAIGVEPAAILGPARRLAAAGLVALSIRQVERDPLGHRQATVSRHEMAPEQRAALDAIAALRPGAELLLEGVAASGKSDVYLAAAADTLAAGRGVIMLVPELSMVPQLADRAAAVAGETLAVLHSGLSAGERHDEWWRIVRGEARLVVGTRTAVFAPLADIGLIVIDEEHDGGYKSDRSPRYDARWVARRRGVLTRARVIAGSATPDLVTLSRVRGGHVERVRLTERRVGRQPTVEVVDMREELAGGNRSVFSRPLANALTGLPEGQRAILLVNRRGASTFILCRDCGESLRCPDCQLPYVFHLEGETLRCHHCGRRARPPERCPQCNSARIRYFGVGTQRVVAELTAQQPRLRVGRLDSDALATRRGFESVYDDFRAGRIDVLVGTQLAAKGLDIPVVSLAAVIAADVTLNLPDYRAAERTWQLLAQVAGRAGRGAVPGRVIIQTYAPDHYAVRAAAALDVDRFADEELTRRRLLGYPPFSLLARLLVADANRERAAERGRQLADLVAGSGVEVLGPLPAYVARRAGRWRFQVVIRAERQDQRTAALERAPAWATIDVDPESLL